MAVAIVQAKCLLEQHRVGGAEGGAIAQGFRSAFRTQIFRSACAKGIYSARCIPAGGQGQRGWPVCALPDLCPVPLVFPARSETSKKDLAPMVQVWIHHPPSGELEIRLVLFGERAATRRTSLESVLERLTTEGTEIPHSSQGADPVWRIRRKADVTLAYEGSLRHYAHCVVPPVLPSSFVVEFSSPCIVASRADSSDATPTLAEIVGNMAYDLAIADLEDGALASALGRGPLDALGGRARQEAEAAIRRLTIEAGNLAPAEWGRLRSGTNPGFVRLNGFTGFLRLSGDLVPAAPWLAALTLRGAGQKRSYGAGEVRLWWPRVP